MVFTQTGRNEIRNWLVGTTSTAPTAMAMGTGSTSALETDTALVGEVFRDASINTSTEPFVAKFESVLSTTDATGSTLREFGLFNETGSTSGDMFCRNTFAEVSKTSSIEMQFEQRIEIE